MADAKLCAVDGCDKHVFCRGWCSTHYQRWKANGDPLIGGWQKKTTCEVEGCGRRNFARGLCSSHYVKSEFKPRCEIDGCGRPAHSQGICTMHKRRLDRNGSVHSRRKAANGELLRWLDDHVGYDGERCLKWPFTTNPAGDGIVKFAGVHSPASRVMCIKAHGPAPSPEHEAAHSCGNGNEGCVHPDHLRWATTLENKADQIEHGTVQRGEIAWCARLTRDQVRSIRAMGSKQPQQEIADMFGISPSHVSKIQHRKAWAWLE